MMTPEEKSHIILIIGDCKVGKTSSVNKLSNEFTMEYSPTIGLNVGTINPDNPPFNIKF